MTVYLLHLDAPLYAQHYLGYARDLAERLHRHAQGNGARLLAVARERGIGWQCVRTWEGGRAVERQLKGRKNAPRMCPICRSKS